MTEGGLLVPLFIAWEGGLVVPLFIAAPESRVTNPRPHAKGVLNGSRTELRRPAHVDSLLESVRQSDEIPFALGTPEEGDPHRKTVDEARRQDDARDIHCPLLGSFW